MVKGKAPKADSAAVRQEPVADIPEGSGPDGPVTRPVRAKKFWNGGIRFGQTQKAADALLGKAGQAFAGTWKGTGASTHSVHHSPGGPDG